jgi:hypothetical protein
MTGLYWTAAMLAVLWAGYTAVRLRRDQSVVVMLSGLCMVSAGASMGLTAQWPGLLQPAPADPVAGWLTISLGLVATWAFLGLLALMAGETAHPFVLVAIPCTAAIAAGLAQAAAPYADGVQPGKWSIPALAAQFVLLACFCPAQARITSIARRFSRRIQVRHYRLGMRAVAAGAAVGLVLILARAALTGSYAAGGPVPGWADGTVSAGQGAAVIAMVAGMTSPAWFRPLSRLLRLAWLWSAYWRLRPLWAALRQAAPQLMLSAPPGARLNIRYRLGRRVVEIRDAALAVRPYCAPDVPGRAEDAAKAAGLDSGKLAAVIEAAVIASGLGSLLRGSPPLPGSAQTAAVIEPPRDDLRAEAARLIEVCRAFRRSTVVRQVSQASQPAGNQD